MIMALIEDKNKKRYFEKLPYVGFETNEEFYEKLLRKIIKKTDKIISINWLKKRNINFKQQKEKNLKFFGQYCDNLDELLNLCLVEPGEYKILNYFKLINDDFEVLEKRIKEDNKKITKLNYSHAINSKYFLKLSLKKTKRRTKKIKTREIICFKNKNKEKYALDYYYYRIKDLLEVLFDFEDNMFGIGKGIDKAVKDVLLADMAVKIDLKNFFNNVTKKQIKNGFKTECKFNLPKKTVNQLIRVCTPLGHPFQGLKTSTLISYIALLPSVKELNKLDNYKKSFYIDDFIVKIPNDWKTAQQLKKQYTDILKKNGFTINKEKTKILFGNKIFFLGVNLKTKKVSYNKYLHYIKAEIFNWSIENNNYKRMNSSHTFKNFVFFRLIEKARKINGKLNYCDHIKPGTTDFLRKHKKYGKIITELEKII